LDGLEQFDGGGEVAALDYVEADDLFVVWHALPSAGAHAAVIGAEHDSFLRRAQATAGRRIGWKHGRWHDVAWVQRALGDDEAPPVEPG
jgi:L-amino acid N-acyltransferase YncA